MKVKICGIQQKQDLDKIVKILPDYLGLIFYPPSKRYMLNSIKKEVVLNIPKPIKSVGVFVNQQIPILIEYVKSYELKAIQLHGDETSDDVLKLVDLLKKENLTVMPEIIKAFGIDKDFNFNKLNDYKHCCDYFLFDTKTINYGGSGERFQWDLMKKYDNQIPFFISGGIGIEELQSVFELKDLNIYAVDMNSKLECKPGFKNIELVKTAVNRIRSHQESSPKSNLII